MLVEKNHSSLSLRQQFKILKISKSGFYKRPNAISAFNLKIMRLIDEEFTRHPFLGVPKMTAYLRNSGYRVNPKRIRRLMRLMSLVPIYPKPNLSKQNKAHLKYPYLLRGMKIDHVNQVWSIDITYIPTETGFCYLVAVMDWHSRYALSWELSNSLDVSFCKSALLQALKYGCPEIFNMDQGSQFTSDEFLNILRFNEIQISMDGKGRALDNVFVERLWRSVKYEEVYLKSYVTMKDAQQGLAEYFRYYNQQRPHQSLNYVAPASEFFKSAKEKKVA